MVLNPIIVAFVFTLLRTASSLSIGERGSTNVVQKEVFDLSEPFPPETPIKVPITPVYQYGVIYHVTVPVKINDYIGRLVVDTGSLATWVPTDDIVNPIYDHMRKYPATLEDMGCDRGPLQYGGGEVYVLGSWAYVDYLIPGGKRKNLKIDLIDYILVDSNGALTVPGVDGIFGAEIPEADSEKIAEAALAGTRFAIDIYPSGSSTLTIGDFDFKAELTVPLSPNSNDRIWTVHSPRLGSILLDSGSSDMLLPGSFVSEYLSTVKSYAPGTEENPHPYWLIDCNQKLGAMKIDLGTAGSIEISGSYLRIPRKSIDEDGRCNTRIFGNEGYVDESVLGMPFFEEHTVTFDKAGNRVGISKNWWKPPS